MYFYSWQPAFCSFETFTGTFSFLQFTTPGQDCVLLCRPITRLQWKRMKRSVHPDFSSSPIRLEICQTGNRVNPSAKYGLTISTLYYGPPSSKRCFFVFNMSYPSLEKSTIYMDFSTKKPYPKRTGRGVVWISANSSHLFPLVFYWYLCPCHLKDSSSKPLNKIHHEGESGLKVSILSLCRGTRREHYCAPVTNIEMVIDDDNMSEGSLLGIVHQNTSSFGGNIWAPIRAVP